MKLQKRPEKLNSTLISFTPHCHGVQWQDKLDQHENHKDPLAWKNKHDLCSLKTN